MNHVMLLSRNAGIRPFFFLLKYSIVGRLPTEFKSNTGILAHAAQSAKIQKLARRTVWLGRICRHAA